MNICSYCAFVIQSCPVIHKTNSFYCYLQIKSAEQNRVCCLLHTLYKDWIYWYVSQSVSAYALCLYAHTVFQIHFFWLYHVVTLHWDHVFVLTLLKNILYAGNFMRRCNYLSCPQDGIVGIATCSWDWIPLGQRFFALCVCVCIYIYST